MRFRTDCKQLANLLVRAEFLPLPNIDLVVHQEIWQLIREEVNMESFLRLVHKLQLDPLNELGCLDHVGLILAKLIY